MKKLISIICCVMFIGVASMAAAEETTTTTTADRTKVAVQIIQLQAQLQLLNNIVVNLSESSKNVEDKIAALKESLKQSSIQPEDTTKVLEERGLDK